ncbi:unnamed protein product [Caenorhabditis auriculariae]|uniref:Uncharacterized protein n=1 Tax=Caenorhabditis auriculariae TaxID=2777116 RepID=A0A8S1H7W1_9PELO|nr:unnamed protein product [Caenorhabditis auriculariae]
MLFLFLFGLFLAVSDGQVLDGTKELKFVQVVWRHGDRSPTDTFPTDYFQESAWKFGGGGWGQLSPLGMSQHLRLGKRLRARYVTGGTYSFLPPVYDSKVMYQWRICWECTDRADITVLQALIFPQDDDWPTGFVPVPIHTVDYDTDYIANMDCICQRRDWLWEMAQKSDEVSAWENSDQVAGLMKNLTVLCGKSYAMADLWVVADSLLIEQIYFNATLRQQNSWFNDDLYNQIVNVNDQSYFYQYGVFKNPVMMNGLDIGKELQIIRAGSLLNDLSMHIQLKSDCSSAAKKDGCDWINGLKYYVYSAHDETVYSLLVALGIEKYAITPHGYPLYSAAGIVEYWYDNADKKDYFKGAWSKPPPFARHGKNA